MGEVGDRRGADIAEAGCHTSREGETVGVCHETYLMEQWCGKRNTMVKQFTLLVVCGVTDHPEISSLVNNYERHVS